MKFTIGNVTLTGMVPEETVQDFRGAPESQVQESTTVGAASATFYLRGNKKSTLTFTIERVHGSAEEAADFCVRHEFQFPVQGLFTYHTDHGELYLPGAVAVVTRYTLLGAATTHAYQIVGGGFLTKLPTSAS